LGDAFEALDKYFWSVQEDPGHEAPDEAFDWIFMMKAEDWEALDRAWEDRPARWRAECAYVLGEGPVESCVGRIERALFDPEMTVAQEAVSSYARQFADEPSKVSVSPVVRERLAVLAERDSSLTPEVLEILQRLK
jgi:hypothetical protein